MREGRGRVMRMFDAGRYLWLIGEAGRLLLAGALRFTSMSKERDMRILWSEGQ